jgi:HPt (histidine-containing phosphotransfer) domain-containing protein
MAPSPLNLETLDSLKECADDDPRFLPELIAAYLSDAEARLAEMRKIHAAGDAVALGRMAHTLKGSSLNLGADGLAGLMQVLERDGKRGVLPPGERLGEGEAEFARVRTALAAYLA